MNNAKFDEYMAKKHPALQTDSEAAYVNVQTKVADKYGIVQLASDLLVAMNFADADAIDTDPKETVNMSANVSDLWAQFTLAVEDLAKDMGSVAEFDLAPSTGIKADVAPQLQAIVKLEEARSLLKLAGSDYEEYGTAAESLANELLDAENEEKPGVMYSEDNGGKAVYWVENGIEYLIGLVDEKGNWYTFSKYRGLVKATADEIETIKFNAGEFETVNDDNGDVYAALLGDDSTAIVHKELLVLHDQNGHAFKFNKQVGLIEAPKYDYYLRTDNFNVGLD
ncbi:hypothetical protein DEJ53_07230 [Weissella confusa]|uniref:hypothetical protein n=1 Tax=Weissella confusa TaxID=1583 RepID=UPI000DCA92F7|nr:hypothetical protein [Weissella confusa]RAU06599.1 hypothetical protein DEJ53_07230 [Weissella confusa]